MYTIHLQELVSEKLKTQQKDNEVERLAHELEMKVLNQESTQQAEPGTPDNRCSYCLLLSFYCNIRGNVPIFTFLPCNRFKMLESELESSLKISLQIKEDKMAALEARLQESSGLNQQLRQELKSVSHGINFVGSTSL